MYWHELDSSNHVIVVFGVIVSATQLRAVAAEKRFQKSPSGFSQYCFRQDFEIPEEPQQGQSFAPSQFDTAEAIGRLDMKDAAAEFFQVHALCPARVLTLLLHFSVQTQPVDNPASYWGTVDSTRPNAFAGVINDQQTYKFRQFRLRR